MLTIVMTFTAGCRPVIASFKHEDVRICPIANHMWLLNCQVELFCEPPYQTDLQKIQFVMIGEHRIKNSKFWSTNVYLLLREQKKSLDQ